jgi:hypothetical protein
MWCKGFVKKILRRTMANIISDYLRRITAFFLRLKNLFYLSLKNLFYLRLKNFLSLNNRNNNKITTIIILIVAVLNISLISYTLNWNILYFFLLIFLTLWPPISLVFLSNKPYKMHVNMGDFVAVFFGNYEHILEKTIDCSSFNNTFILLNLAILISSVINGLLFSNSKSGIFSTLLYIWKNKKDIGKNTKDFLVDIRKNKRIFFIFLGILVFIGVAIILVICLINSVLFMLGLGIVVNTTSIGMFLYTFLAKVTSIRVVLTIIICSITKKINLQHISLTISSLLLMVTLGSLNYFYIVPYLYPLVLTNLSTLYSFYTNILITNNLTSFCEILNIIGNGLYDILIKFPMLGRYVGGFFSSLKATNNVYVDSPFRNHITPLVKKVIPIYPFNKISKFTPITFPRMVENHVEVSYLFETHVSNFRLFLSNNSEVIKVYVSDLAFKYSNLNLRLKVGLEDQTTNIKASFKNGCLESYTVKSTNVKDSFCYSKPTNNHNFNYKSVLPFDSDSLAWLYNLNITPPDVNSKLTVFMNNSNDNFGYSDITENLSEVVEDHRGTKRARTGSEEANTAKKVDKGKQRAIESPDIIDTAEDTSTRSKIELTEHKWIYVTEEDFNGKTWDLNSIYKKINNIMEHPEYNRQWRVRCLFKTDELAAKFYNDIKSSLLKEVKYFNEMTFSSLKNNIGLMIKQNSLYTIRKEDFVIDNLGNPSLYNKIIQFMSQEDGYVKSWTITRLIFEPFSLKYEFYDAIKNLGFSKVPSTLTISSLRNKLKNHYNIDSPASAFNIGSSASAFNIGSSDNTFNTEYESEYDSDSESEININVNPNMITRKDVIGGGDFNAYSIYGKLKNITESQDFDKNSKIKSLVYEDRLLRREFQTYINSRGMLKSKYIGKVNILYLKNVLEKILDLD